MQDGPSVAQCGAQGPMEQPRIAYLVPLPTLDGSSIKNLVKANANTLSSAITIMVHICAFIWYEGPTSYGATTTVSTAVLAVGIAAFSLLFDKAIYDTARAVGMFWLLWMIYILSFRIAMTSFPSTGHALGLPMLWYFFLETEIKKRIKDSDSRVPRIIKPFKTHVFDGFLCLAAFAGVQVLKSRWHDLLTWAGIFINVNDYAIGAYPVHQQPTAVVVFAFLVGALLLWCYIRLPTRMFWCAAGTGIVFAAASAMAISPGRAANGVVQDGHALFVALSVAVTYLKPSDVLIVRTEE
ncbi:hypothetical protein CALVIDRAFT_543351 [Calocera viscosa TUFC12733]|uniref:Uncharacterized protein n=1 Tax=Calocera viscosa (strain TUFC12733) TaxID=1330018 RepID=A0A167FPS6_CALVF|nr:hypothetical protein CALVIDRAFT_543351 [Calocera viscosa TUFC12733]